MNPASLIRKRDLQRPLPSGNELRILAVQIAGIGDLILATPALDALHERYPEAKIDIVTSPRSADLLQGHPSIDDIYAFDVSRFRNPIALLLPGALADLRIQLKPLRDVRYDLLVSLHNISSFRGAFTLGLLMRSLEIPFWVGRNTDGRMPLFDRELRESLKDPVPEPMTKLRLVGLLDAKPDPRPLSIAIGQNERAKARDLLGQKHKWAAIMPGCDDPNRRWPTERFSDVARQLADKGFRIVLLGGPGEETVGAEVAAAAKERTLNLVGKLGLKTMAAVLQLCSVAITNNTGPMHIAAAAGVPIVALFAPVHVERYRPWAAKETVRVLFTENSSLTGGGPDAIRMALQDINVEQVIAAVDELTGTGR